MTRSLIILVFALVSARSAWPGTVAAVSCSAANVQTAIDFAGDGDIITVSFGSFRMAASAAVRKSMTLLGVGEHE